MSGRASINLITNTIYLPGLEELPIDVLINREFPVEMMLPFLHEVTHHWCFNSPVGLTQPLFYADAMSRMFTSAWDGEVASLEVRDLFTRCLILDDLLGPLYEGMAPGDPGKSPYLAGYMSVLACFYRAASRIELFRDPTFFISYFKTFMFDDLEFTECILRPGRSLLQFFIDVYNYLQARFNLFFSMDHADWAERLNQRFLEGSNVDPGMARESDDASAEVIPRDFFTIANTSDAANSGRVALNQRVQALYKLAIGQEGKTLNGQAAEAISFILAHLLSTRFTIRLASRKVWVVNFDNDIGLADTETTYTSLVAREGGRMVPLRIKDRVSDGPAILECVAHGTTPFFVLRAVEENRAGPVLATFGHAAGHTPPTPSEWSHDKTSRLSALSASVLTPGKDGRYAQEIQEMSNLVVLARQKLHLVYGGAMEFHHLKEQPVTTEFLKDGFKGVLQDRALVKALAALSIFSVFAVPEKLRLVGQRSAWEWLVSVGMPDGIWCFEEIPRWRWCSSAEAAAILVWF